MIEKNLLVDETFIKSVTNISDNIRSKLIEPAIFEAQNEDLRGVLGDRLLSRLIDLVVSGDIYKEEYSNYKELLIKCQYFLAYTVASNICILTAVKIDNAGLQQVSDERMNPLSISECFQIQKYYTNRADYLCKQLQNYLLQNKSLFPELCHNSIHSIKSNLNSAASCGIFLGGPRGRKINK